MGRIIPRFYRRDEFQSTIEAVEKGIDFNRNVEEIILGLEGKKSKSKERAARVLAKKLSYTHSASMAGIVNMLTFGNRGYVSLESEGCSQAGHITNGLDAEMGWSDSVYLTLGLVNSNYGDFALVYDRQEIERIESFV